MAVNPYAAPSADVNAEAAGDAGSLEAALAGNYDFTIEEVMKEGWRLTSGFKLTFWGVAIVFFVAMAIVGGILGVVLAKVGIPGLVVRQIVSSALGGVAALCIYTLGFRRAAGLPTSMGDAFSKLDQWLPAIIAGILVTVIVLLGFLLLLIPGIYLGVAYCMTVPLIADRKMGVWDAMETSRKAVSHKWFTIAGTFLVVGLLTVLSAVLLFIPLIWTAPWYLACHGVVYRRVFGVATTQ
jgi:hypothetical protein